MLLGTAGQLKGRTDVECSRGGGELMLNGGGVGVGED